MDFARPPRPHHRWRFATRLRRATQRTSLENRPGPPTHGFAWPGRTLAQQLQKLAKSIKICLTMGMQAEHVSSNATSRSFAAGFALRAQRSFLHLAPRPQLALSLLLPIGCRA